MNEQKYSVIVAEDEELLLNNLVQKLQRLDLGLTVVGTAQTGSRAYELVEQLNPDILIADIRMPVMDGLELLSRVRQRFPLIRTMITSSYSDFEYARTAITIGVCEYLLKPVDPEELYAAMFKIVSQLKAEQSAYEDIFNPETTRNTPAHIAELLKDFILSNYQTDINLNLIAGNMNYSPSYLTRLFCQQYGSTPSRYITSLRIQKAQFLLTHNPELSVRQIGETVGYHEQGYFSRIFKKQVGVSPVEYRESPE